MQAPTDIKAITSDQVLQITWPGDEVWQYPFRFLREECQCAQCVHEITGERLLDVSQIPADLHIEHLALTGNYALKIRWSDGHDTGLYTWERLLQLRDQSPCVKISPS